MEQKKHYIKVFFTDDGESFVCNLDGCVTKVASSIDDLRMKIGTDINLEIKEDYASQQGEVHGYRIDYILTPITKSPFK